MGDMSDYYMDQALDAGEWFPSNQRFVRQSPIHFTNTHDSVPTTKTCNRCGKGGLIWRIADGGGWRLYEDKRVQPGNYKPLHVCGPDPSTDFD